MLTKIGELSKKTGVHVETIRYYERLHLIPKPKRSESGHRFYNDVHRKRLAFIRRCRLLDFSLDEIRFLLQAVETDNPSCSEVEKFSAHHLARLQAKIEDFRAMEKTLQALLAQCRTHDGPTCPLIDVLYEK